MAKRRRPKRSVVEASLRNVEAAGDAHDMREAREVIRTLEKQESDARAAREAARQLEGKTAPTPGGHDEPEARPVPARMPAVAKVPGATCQTCLTARPEGPDDVPCRYCGFALVTEFEAPRPARRGAAPYRLGAGVPAADERLKRVWLEFRCRTVKRDALLASLVGVLALLALSIGLALFFSRPAWGEKAESLRVYGLPVLLGLWVPCLYWFLACASNRVRFELDSAELRVSYRPFPWRGRRIPRAEVHKFVAAKTSMSSEEYGSRPDRHYVKVVLVGRKDLSLQLPFAADAERVAALLRHHWEPWLWPNPNKVGDADLA